MIVFKVIKHPWATTNSQYENHIKMLLEMTSLCSFEKYTNVELCVTKLPDPPFNKLLIYYLQHMSYYFSG